VRHSESLSPTFCKLEPPIRFRAADDPCLLYHCIRTATLSLRSLASCLSPCLVRAPFAPFLSASAAGCVCWRCSDSAVRVCVSPVRSWWLICLACCIWCAARLGSCEQAQAQHDQRDGEGVVRVCAEYSGLHARAGCGARVQGAVCKAVSCHSASSVGVRGVIGVRRLGHCCGLCESLRVVAVGGRGQAARGVGWLCTGFC